MRLVDKRTKVSRRGFLGGTGAATVGLVGLSVSAGMVASSTGAWAVSVKNLKPETMQTLIQIARDTYPHDRLADKYYAASMAGYDDQAGSDAGVKDMLESGAASLNEMAMAQHGVGYAAVGWEIDRVALLKQIEGGAFFQTIRGGLVVSLYNNREVWPKFGYEGPSADQGGYINRGFDDVDWL